MNLSELRVVTSAMPAQYQIMIRHHDIILPAIAFEINQNNIIVKANEDGLLRLNDLRNLNFMGQNQLMFEFNQRLHSVFGYRVDEMYLILG